MKQEAWEDMAGVVKELSMNLRSLNANIARLNSIVSGLRFTHVTGKHTLARAFTGQHTEGHRTCLEAAL